MVIVFKWKSGGSYSCNDDQLKPGSSDIINLINNMDDDAEINLFGQKYPKNELDSIEILVHKKLIDGKVMDI